MLVKVRVQPKSSWSRVDVLADGSLKAWLTAAPEGGKANAELVEVVAEHFEVRKSGVRVVRGAKSRDKTVEVTL